MSISIAGIDIPNALIDAEFRIGVLERIIDRIVTVTPSGTITAEMVESMRADTLKSLQQKYPEAGIRAK